MPVRCKYVLGVVLAVAIPGNLYLMFTYMDVNLSPVTSTLQISGLCRSLLKVGNDQVSNKTATGTSVTEWWQAAALLYWSFVSPVEYKCKSLTAVGNWHLCQDQPYAVKPPCLVYSFGIANDFSFDDAMGKIGCEVHSFDPSMHKEDHRRSDRVTFHAMGLSGVDSDTFEARKDMYVKNTQLWKIRTLKTIMKELGHEHRVLDVLKIDVEGHEWAVVKNIMEDGIFKKIRQFYLEWHLFPDWPAKSSYVSLYQLYTKLTQLGLTAFRKSPHPHNFNPRSFNIQGDNNYINLNFTSVA
ncbi:probable methyltransferase-like protein 24 [Haliotis rubra]|uniref:probable methyltransferase-like protein 24 n=1 Tax=Haliotis rubra TaxID=36100 RepID=UPI001EE5F60D|nr:probable methyltransferase-like protein 24 [Haliotis rubra]